MSGPSQGSGPESPSESVIEELVDNRNVNHRNIDTIPNPNNTNTNTNTNDNDNDSENDNDNFTAALPLMNITIITKIIFVLTQPTLVLY